MARVYVLLLIHSSPFVIVVYILPYKVRETKNFIYLMNLPPRVQIILYITQKGIDRDNVFPVNKLRNIGIVNIETSHFIVLDMDMWPARTLSLCLFIHSEFV